MSSREAVFVDTNGWIALLERDDELHVLATARWDQVRAAGRPLISTDWVFAETGNGLSRVRARRRVAGTVRKFLESPNCRLVQIDQRLFLEALDLYDRTTDKSWGLVDCASFVVMRQEHMLDAFTTDHHFEQAGFRRLLAPQPR